MSPEVTSRRLATRAAHPPVTQSAFHILFAGAAPAVGVTGTQAASRIAGAGPAKKTGRGEGVQRAAPEWERPILLPRS